MKKIWKRSLSAALAAVLALALALSASAVTFTVPTTPMSTDDGVIKTTAMRAGQAAPVILGCDLVGTGNLGGSMDDAGNINYNKLGTIMGIFGSAVNESPDPWLWNYNYNLYAADNGLAPVENATVAVAALEGQGASLEDTAAMMVHRPDLLLSQGPGIGSSEMNASYTAALATLPENTDDDPTNDYAPGYYTCSISTLVYQCENLISLSEVVKGICAEKGLTTRYGDAYTIATNYDKYVWGYYFYIMEQLAAGNIAKKTAAVVSNTQDSGATWTLPAKGTSVSQGKPNRLVEYLRDNTDMLNTTEEGTATLAEVLACDVVVANNRGDALREAAAAAGYAEESLPLIIDTLPNCLYGMVMQTHENALGIPYFQSMIYGDELGLSPVYAAAYFYENFFHITEDDALQETVSTLLSDATLPAGTTTSIADYDPASIEALIVEGIDYAVANGLARHDDTAAWDPDLSVGIGTRTPAFGFCMITAQTVTFNGGAVDMDLYNIDDHTYYKLRDIAALLSGTAYAFDIGFDAGTCSVYAETGKPYVKLDTDLQKSEDRSGTCEVSAWKLYVDGKIASCYIYNIGGNNYFKLADLAEAFGFGIGYIEDTQTVQIFAR